MEVILRVRRDGTIRGHHNTPPHATQHSGMPGWGPEGSIRVAISAREVHAHKINAYRIPAHKVGMPIRCTPMRCPPMICTPINTRLYDARP